MKILQITPAFVPSEFGGIKMQSYYLSRELVRRGHDVTVYTSNAYSNMTKSDRRGAYDVDGIKVIYFNIYLSRRLTLLFFTPGIVKALRGELKGYDIVHQHGIRTFQSLSYYYCSKYGVPYVISPHGSLPRVNDWVFVKKIYDCLLGNRILAGASRVIALTPVEAEQCRELGLKESQIVQSTNGIDVEEFAQLPERGAFRGRYHIDEKNVILFLGRIHKIKGLDVLAGAFAEVLRDGVDARLVIAGPDYGYCGELKNTLRILNVEDKVTFTGFLSGLDKIQAYVDADIYVLPSIYESFSTTVLEALACGTPVIMTDRCALADVIKSQAGLVVPYDKEQLREAILHMLGDDKMRLQFGKKGQSLVRERFNWEKIAEQVERVYRGILRGTGE